METSPDSSALKRKRSPSSASQPSSAPVAKASKTGSNQLSINYLARQSQEDLPLINKDDTLPNLLHLLSSYSNILDRHESLASNLGARPLGPILIKRFERCFDAPPKIVAHHRGASNLEDGHQITWLEVIEFARSHPTQFNLSTFSEGKRVCQFYYPQKQLRVQISEEDFLFINSGRCQELIPPLPIWEDEEKEVATCDVLDSKLKELTNAADSIAARTRQLCHRLKGRKAAILERRAEGGSGTPAKASVQQTTTAPSVSSAPSAASGAGFTAVNTGGGKSTADSEPPVSSNAAVRSDLLRHFESLPQNQGQSQSRPPARQHSITTIPDNITQAAKTTESARESGGRDSTASSLSPVPANAFSNDPLSYYVTDAPTISRQPTVSGHRPSSSTGSQPTGQAPFKHNFSRPLPPAMESSQPFRPLCQAHMDSLPRGQRVLPPCDRCRRLRMDCVKNLTSCAGCTRKHARCHWRDVSRDELGALDHLMETAYTAADGEATKSGANGQTNGYSHGNGELPNETHDDSDDDDDDSNPLEDLEAIGEKAEREHEAAEERQREDEEGLQHAKDLARQGWEESLRTSQQDLEDKSHEDEAVVSRSDHSTAFVPLINGESEVQKDKPVEALTEVRATTTNDDNASASTSVSYGGFRAVNEALNGWQAT